MSQRDLNEMVARATGESLIGGGSIGFSFGRSAGCEQRPRASPAAGTRLGQHVPGRLAPLVTVQKTMAIVRRAQSSIQEYHNHALETEHRDLSQSRRAKLRLAGATVGMEMEVDSSLVDQPRELHQRINRLFRLAKASVDRELAARGRHFEPLSPPLLCMPSHRQSVRRASRDRQAAGAGARGGSEEAIWRLSSRRLVARTGQRADRRHQTVQ